MRNLREKRGQNRDQRSHIGKLGYRKDGKSDHPFGARNGEQHVVLDRISCMCYIFRTYQSLSVVSATSIGSTMSCNSLHSQLPQNGFRSAVWVAWLCFKSIKTGWSNTHHKNSNR